MVSSSGTSICTEAMVAAFQAGSNRPVGEAQREDVLHRLLSEEVVDAEDLVLTDDPVQRRFELACCLQVGPERLLHDEAATVGETLSAQHGDHRLHGVGRHRQVQEATDLTREMLLCPLYRGSQICTVVSGRGTEGDPADQVVSHLVVEIVDALDQPVAHLLPELVVASGRVPTRPDDRVVGRQSPRCSQPVQAGEQLALGQIARRSEEDEHLWSGTLGHGNAHVPILPPRSQSSFSRRRSRRTQMSGVVVGRPPILSSEDANVPGTLVARLLAGR
jgi:hypothetical protein